MKECGRFAIAVIEVVLQEAERLRLPEPSE
jgi:hypothetical protein